MSKIRATTLAKQDDSASVPVDTVIKGSAKAWVNFDGTVAAASMIRRAFNVTSITDSGTGIYVINFASAMANDTYAVVAGMSYTNTAPGWDHVSPGMNKTVSSFEVRVSANNGTALDNGLIQLAVFS